MAVIVRPQQMRPLSCRSIAAALSLTVLVTMAALARWDPDSAGRLAAENDVIEWTQVALLGASAALSARSALVRHLAGLSAPLETLLTAGLLGVICRELDLDKRIFGVKLRPRFLLDAALWRPYRLLAGTLIIAIPLGLAAYAIHRRAELRAALLRLIREPWGHVVLAGVAVVALTEALERQLGALPLPRYALEESLELVAVICLFVGLVARRSV